MSDPPERITVSVETLRGELAQLELRLVDRLTAALSQKADVAHLEQIEARVQSLELTRAGREGHATLLAEHAREIESFKRWRWQFPSLAMVSILVAVIALLLGIKPDVFG